MSSIIAQVEKVASAHAGRTLIKGCSPWLREGDKYVLFVDGEERGFGWLESYRPDLSEKYKSFKDLHNSLARCRWLEIANNLGVKAEVERIEGGSTNYVYDWITTKVIEETFEENSVGGEIHSGLHFQELVLRSPDGEHLLSTESRTLKFSRGNYPTGDFSYCN